MGWIIAAIILVSLGITNFMGGILPAMTAFQEIVLVLITLSFFSLATISLLIGILLKK